MTVVAAPHYRQMTDGWKFHALLIVLTLINKKIRKTLLYILA